jgi:hypothetical protein
MLEEVVGGEDVAPRDFAAIGHDGSHHALAFQAGCPFGKAPL